MTKEPSPTPFYSLSVEQRVELVCSATRERRTLIERWQALETIESSPWNERAAFAAKMLENPSSVADLGCGGMQLEGYLPPSCRYIPIDVVRRDSRTIVVDLNSGRLPDLKASAYAALGLIEYIYDPRVLMSDIRGLMVVSYNPTDYNANHRVEHAWVNHMSAREFESMVTNIGWSVQEVLRLDNQLLWKMTR